MKCLALLTLAFWSFSGFAALSNYLVVEGVHSSRNNQDITGVNPFQECVSFKGTHHGNTIELKPVARGGSGKYRHRLMWQLSEGYDTFEGQRTQIELGVRDGRVAYMEIPELKNDVSYLQQSVLLVSEDLDTRQSVTTQIMFNVSRPVVLSQTTDPLKMQKNCYQVMPAIESVSGILTNGSTNPSQLLIRHGIQSLWTRTKGAQWGFFISPLAWSGLGNIFSFYKNYFTQYSKQTIETVEVSSEHQIAPGDYLQIYEQRTRYISAFDAYAVDVCGKSKPIEGTYFLQWWGVAYHAYPVNPFSNERTPREAIGVSPMNSCPQELTPDFLNDNEEYIFARTI